LLDLDTFGRSANAFKKEGFPFAAGRIQNIDRLGLPMHHYIVIEGPLGVGKTSLAMMVAEKLDGQALLEDVEENPFLVSFYQNPEKYAFQTQIRNIGSTNNCSRFFGRESWRRIW
jgi:hypothetical protein